MPSPVLHLLAGPNGSGKTTLAELVLRPATGLRFINADVIAAREWPDAPGEHAYQASALAADERAALLDEGASFITETVFSHPSKVDLVLRAAALGYLVHLHVVMVPAALPVARVAARVARGGHDVPPEKVRERFERLWPLVVTAIRSADRATCYDNTRASAPFRVVAEYRRGLPVGQPDWPRWTPEVLVR